MADVSKLRRRTLGVPPSLDEASDNLSAPEHAPAAPAPDPAAPSPTADPVPSAPAPTPAAAKRRPPTPPPVEPTPRLDGRSLRKTHRLIPFATRVSPEFDEKVRAIAQRDQIFIVEVLERGLEAYEREKRQPRK